MLACYYPFAMLKRTPRQTSITTPVPFDVMSGDMKNISTEPLFTHLTPQPDSTVVALGRASEQTPSLAREVVRGAALGVVAPSACPRCRFALVAYMGHDTCSMGCGWDGERRAPTADERSSYRKRDAQLTKRMTK